MNKEHKADVTINLNYTYDTSRFVQVSEPTNQIKASIIGTGWDLLINKINSHDITINIPSDGIPIRQQALWDKTKKKFENLKVNYIFSHNIQTGIDEYIEKSVLLLLDSATIPILQSRRLSNFKILPKRLKITGPKSILQNFGILKVGIEEYEVNGDKFISFAKPLIDTSYKLKEVEGKVHIEADANEKPWLKSKLRLRLSKGNDKYKLSSDTLWVACYFNTDEEAVDARQALEKEILVSTDLFKESPSTLSSQLLNIKHSPFCVYKPEEIKLIKIE